MRKFRFVADIYPNPNILAQGLGKYIDPLSHTCDEWFVIAEEGLSISNNDRLFINCNPMSAYYGKLLFYSPCDHGSGYVSPFYFDDFLSILIDKYDVLTKINTKDNRRNYNGSGVYSIINFFACNRKIDVFYEKFYSNFNNKFNCNKYFSTHSKNVFDYISCKYDYLFIT